MSKAAIVRQTAKYYLDLSVSSSRFQNNIFVLQHCGQLIWCYIMSGIQQNCFSCIVSSEESIPLFLCRVQCFSHFVYSRITIDCLKHARISSKFHPNKVDLLVHAGLFHPTKVRSCFFQIATWVGRLTYISYEHVSVSQELHRDNKISAKPVNPVKRISLTPYEQPLINNKLGTSKKNNDLSGIWQGRSHDLYIILSN